MYKFFHSKTIQTSKQLRQHMLPTLPKENMHLMITPKLTDESITFLMVKLF